MYLYIILGFGKIENCVEFNLKNILKKLDLIIDF